MDKFGYLNNKSQEDIIIWIYNKTKLKSGIKSLLPLMLVGAADGGGISNSCGQETGVRVL